jgi:hypothetical protein
MCCILNSYYVLYFQFNVIYFLKFIVHKTNSKMVKSGMVKLTGREKTDVTDIDVTVGWML